MFRGYDATSRAIAAVGVCLVAAIVTVAAIAIVQLRKQAVQVTHQRAQGQAVSLAAHANQALSSADFILRSIQREVSASGVTDERQLHDRFGSKEDDALAMFRSGKFQPVDLIVIADANGELVSDSAPKRAGKVNVADREYFRQAESSATDMLWVTAPIRTRVYGTLDFFLARRLQSRDGRFLGVVAVGMSSHDFGRLYEDLRLGHADTGLRDASSITLLRQDMTVLARAPANDALLGARLAADGAYAAWTTAATSDRNPAQTWDSTRASRSRVDVVVREVPGVPLMIAVATDESIYLAEWRHQAWMIGSMAAAAVACFAYMFIGLVRALRRREEYLVENERLRQVAEAASKAKSQFLATVSHEIRTPMNGILGTAELLADRALPDDEQRLAAMLLRSGRQLLGMLDDVLDFSKIEAGELTIGLEPFDPRAALLDVYNLFSAIASAKGLSLELDVAPDVPARIRGDAGRVRQVLGNLVGNAIKFTDTGLVAMHVSLSGSKKADRMLRFVVEDTGVGIPPEARNRIFDHFAQADGSVSRRFGGTGLGLAISRRLALLMGGNLDYEDRRAGGSCFVFTVPLINARDELPTADEPELPVDARAAQPRLASMHVLVTEDNAVNAMVAEAQLASLGCTCDIAVDGEDALAHLAHTHYDVVLMDCMLPGVSGYEAARLWRSREALEGRPHLPIIALTANVMASNVCHAREAGMDDFLTKPCSIEALREALMRASRSASSASQHVGSQTTV